MMELEKQLRDILYIYDNFNLQDEFSNVSLGWWWQ